MKCPSCNFIFFRSAKKCPSCGGGLTRAAYAEQPDEEFTIYASAGGGLGLSDGDAFGAEDDLGGGLYAEADTFGEEDQDNFNLDLSDLDAPAEPVAEVPPEPEVPVEDTLNFDLGSGEFSDVDVDGIGIDLETPDEPAMDLDLGVTEEEPSMDLDLGEPDLSPEPDLDLDLGGDAEPEISLDEGPEVELDLGGDDPAADDGIELDLDLGDDDSTGAPAASAEPSADDGLDLEIDGLELDLDLDSDEDK